MFISFEGGEGSGKTTLINSIKSHLETLKVSYIATREPGGSGIADKIRHIVLDMSSAGMDSYTEALLYAASRRQHIVERVRPALAAGNVVLTDRYVDSSWAYQGVGRNLGVERVKELNEWAIEGLMPIRTYYLDIDPVLGLRRIHEGRTQEINRLDVESLEFHNSIRQAYFRFAEEEPARYRMIDASGTKEETFEAVWSDLRILLGI